MLPPLSVWFREKVCRKAPEGVSLGPLAEPWPRSHKNRIKERRRSDLRNGFRALPDAPDQQRTSGPARAIVEDRVIYETTASQDEKGTRGSGMSAVARQGKVKQRGSHSKVDSRSEGRGARQQQ